MVDKETIEALHKQGEMLDKIAKINYLTYMAQQQNEKQKVPTSTVFGSYYFNPYNDANILVQWRQVVPRNDRRKNITLSALNQTLFLATSDNSVTIDNLVTLQNTGWNGTLPVMVYTFTANNNLILETTEAVYIASLVGGGVMKEQQAIVSWAEMVYSSAAAIPFDNKDAAIGRPDERFNLTVGHLDADDTNKFTREGVR